MAAKRPAKKTTRRPARKPAPRTPAARRPPRGNNPAERIAAWIAGWLARHARAHRDSVRSRKDAAILRATHAGCGKCHGTGTVFTRGRDGEFTGSKPCTAKPTVTKVSRATIHTAARFGPDKHSGLIGWSCPCGTRQKPRFRDAKTATAALRHHEKTKHGSKSVGGTWYAQLPASAAPTTTKTPAAKTAPAKTPAGRTA
jgi:hypothetical protein